MRVIAIEIHGPNDFTVRELERYQDHLCWDEMLGTIAELTHPRIGQARYRMQTREEHAAQEARWRSAEHPTYVEPPLLEGPKAVVEMPELEVGADGTIRTKTPTTAREVVASFSSKHATLAPVFAAAPDLLDVLLELTDIEGPLPGTRDWHAKATAAIAKARGDA